MPEQINKPASKYEQQKADEAYAKELAEADAAAAERRAEAEDTLSELDALLDEIDGVLEENAEDFVKAYQQKGGQ